MKKIFKAVNWNQIQDSFSKVFWDQNIRQFWVDEEIPLSGDKLTWKEKLTDEEKDIYTKVLVSLTLLDTHQGAVGMSNMTLKIKNLHTKAILQFIGMMEQMHAKSYSTIFSTLCSTEEINDLFVWSEKNEFLQKKLEIISEYYENITDDESLYMSMVASVFLESFLFYSGFYYPLLLSGRGLMIKSGEIINLIIRDEAVHGLYIGLTSIELKKSFSREQIERLDKKTIQLLEQLMENEVNYSKEIYDKIGVFDDVYKFLQYNANKSLQNLGFPNHYNITHRDINPIVFNGLKTTTKNHDFFSTKGNGYIKTTRVEEISDDDFIFD